MEVVGIDLALEAVFVVAPWWPENRKKVQFSKKTKFVKSHKNGKNSAISNCWNISLSANLSFLKSGYTLQKKEVYA